MMQPVKDDKQVDVVIHIGTDHLTSHTMVYVSKLNCREFCVIDLSLPNAFDETGAYNLDSKALIPAANMFEDPCMEDTDAFVMAESDPVLAFQSGNYIFLRPSAVRNPAALVQSDRNIPSNIHEGDPIDAYSHLTHVLFHELTHSLLLGEEGERRKPSSRTHSSLTNRFLVHDELVPTCVKKQADAEDCALPEETKIKLKTGEKMYGDLLCSLSAKSKRHTYLCLLNSDSYTYFALACYLSQGEWTF